MFDSNFSNVEKNEKKEFKQSIVSFEDDEEDLQQLNFPSAKPKPEQTFESKMFAALQQDKKSGGSNTGAGMLDSGQGEAKTTKNPISDQFSYQSPQKNGDISLNGSGLLNSPAPLLGGKTPDYLSKQGQDERDQVQKSHEIIKRVNFDLKTPQQNNTNALEAKPMSVQLQMKMNRNFFYSSLPQEHVSKFFDLPPLGQRWRFGLSLIGPNAVAIIVLLIIWDIQRSVGDFCGTATCRCENFGIRIWGFFKQLFLFKLGLIACKLIIFRRDLLCSLWEERLYLVITICLDFIIFVLGNYTQDWIFVVWNMGFSVFVGSLLFFSKKEKLPGLPGYLYEIRNLLLYDMYYISVFLLLSIVFPKAQKQLITDYKDAEMGGSFYLLLFVLLLDNGLNWFSEAFVDLSNAGFYFLSRVTHAIVLGAQWGVFFNIRQDNWAYWVTFFLLLLRKINSMTYYIYIMLMKFLYQNLPPASRFYFSLPEVGLNRRYRNGLVFENVFLLLVFYIIYGNNHSYIPYLFEKEYYVIDDCSFKTKLDTIKDYQPIYVYILFLASELVSLIANRFLRYDLIKYPTDFQFNLLEKTLVTLTTYYFFYYSFFVNQVNLWRMLYPVF